MVVMRKWVIKWVIKKCIFKNVQTSGLVAKYHDAPKGIVWGLFLYLL